MPDDKLSAKHRWALLALMGLTGEASNPELNEMVGFTLVNPERQRLNDLKLVTSRKEGRYFVHKLTEAGWHWCEEELSGHRPERTGSAGGAVYAVLGLLRRYLERSDLSLAEFCQQAGTQQNLQADVDIEDRIRGAYQNLASRPGKWVSLTELRQLLPNSNHSEVDDVLRRMNRTPEVHIVPESNQKALSQADREAAVRIGGQDSHLISIEGT